jgi:hypothetical protein
MMKRPFSLTRINDLLKMRSTGSSAVRVADLEAENARLQEHADIATETSLRVIEERDRYKALAERRRLALVRFGEHDDTCPDYLEMDSPATKACNCGLGAAIDATPDEAREKDGD